MRRPPIAGIDPNLPLDNAPFVAFDTELTGLDFKRDSIISVGAVRMRGRRILPGRCFYRLVRPDTELKSQGVVIHGLTHSDLSGAEPSTSVLRDFAEFLGDGILVGHFVFIDLQFVNRTIEKFSGAGLANPVIDTADVQRWLAERGDLPAAEEPWEPAGSDLFTTARRCGIELKRVHNALYDAFVAAQLLQRFLPLLERHGVGTVRELLELSCP